jgi:hypothetical protein
VFQNGSGSKLGFHPLTFANKLPASNSPIDTPPKKCSPEPMKPPTEIQPLLMNELGALPDQMADFPRFAA